MMFLDNDEHMKLPPFWIFDGCIVDISSASSRSCLGVSCAFFQSAVEADSFECFVRLLSGSVDHFCQQLDNSSVGIHSTLLHFSQLLKANDEELWRHLDNSKVFDKSQSCIFHMVMRSFYNDCVSIGKKPKQCCLDGKIQNASMGCSILV